MNTDSSAERLCCKYSADDFDELAYNYATGWAPYWRLGSTFLVAEWIEGHALAEGHAQSYGWTDDE